MREIPAAQRTFIEFMSHPSKRKEGVDYVYFFNNGDVSRYDFPLPECLEKAIRSKLDSRKYGYSRPTGDDGVTKRVSQYEKARSGNETIKRSNICLTTGVTNGLELILSTLDLDELIIPTPTYPAGEAIAVKNGVDVKKLKTKRENNFLPTASELEESIDENTSGILLVSPNNPTGTEYSPETMTQIYDLCKEKGIYLIVDEIFSGIMLNDNEHTIPAYDIEDGNVIRVNGWSKDRGVAGFRLGYIVASEKFTKELADTITLTFGNAPTVYNNFVLKDMSMRKLMIKGKEGDCELDEYRERMESNIRKYELNNQLVHSLLKDCTLDMTNTHGGYTKFIRFDTDDSVQFVRDLYENTGVILVPGEGFDAEPGWARITFSIAPEKLGEGLTKVRNYLK